MTYANQHLVDGISDLTPVERRGEFFFKRDDLFSIAGVRGGKVRTCWVLAQGAKGLVTAGSRSSPQVNIVASIARKMNIPCRVHVPEGELLPEVKAAKEKGAEVIQHKAGYNSVICARARSDAKACGFREIPFGMECSAAIHHTSLQVQNLFTKIHYDGYTKEVQPKRILMPVGSGMSLIGVLTGLRNMGMADFPVKAVQVGANPDKRFKLFGCPGAAVEIVKSSADYHDGIAPRDCIFAGILFDPIYEAKCLPFLRAGDLMWVVGIRETAAPLCRQDIDGDCKWAQCPEITNGDAYGRCPLDIRYATPCS